MEKHQTKQQNPIEEEEKMVFWDYKSHSAKKRIQRIAVFFPQIGRDKKTVAELYKNIDTLNIALGNKKLIKFYYELIKKGVLS